jgi:DGQHR domain-containing protein
MPEPTELRLAALEIRQGPNRLLYSFAVDGKRLSDFATISRVHREDGGELQGYQRPEVRSHIAEIRAYLESDDPMIPNAIVIAFDPRVRFESSDVQPLGQGFSRLGTLIIPADPSLPPEDRPGWIVDGQQRAAAIREADMEQFPIYVTAFITGDDQEQKEQFILVNSTKPLPKGLIYELLPATESRLPAPLQRRRFPALLLDRLNRDEDSPFYKLIQTPTNPNGLVKDNSILKMLEHSLENGALNWFRDPRTGRGDVEPMLKLLKRFWSVVAEVFPDAWGKKPVHSRLMHGAGIISMGLVMDAIFDRYEEVPSEQEFRADLEPLAEICCWTRSEGRWAFAPDDQRKWNEVQNTPNDIQLLADFLLTQYRRRVWARERGQRLASVG